MEIRRRAQEAHVEEEREEEKKRCEEDANERVVVVPNMEAGSSYLQTTDRRAEVEKFVMDGLEERKLERRSDGLVRGRERTGVRRDQWKGERKGDGGKGEHEGKGGFEGSRGAPQSTRKVQDEEEEVRGKDECREAKFMRNLRQLEEKRKAQEE